MYHDITTHIITTSRHDNNIDNIDVEESTEGPQDPTGNAPVMHLRMLYR